MTLEFIAIFGGLVVGLIWAETSMWKCTRNYYYMHRRIKTWCGWPSYNWPKNSSAYNGCWSLFLLWLVTTIRKWKPNTIRRWPFGNCSKWHGNPSEPITTWNIIGKSFNSPTWRFFNKHINNNLIVVESKDIAWG